jgi:hypothetical protein
MRINTEAETFIRGCLSDILVCSYQTPDAEKNLPFLIEVQTKSNQPS